MPLNYKASGSGGDYDPVPAGTHIAVCDMVVDIGVQPGSGMFPKPKPQVFIRFQLPNEQIEFERDGKKLTGPRVIGSTYTASMSEKANLRRDLESWRGKQFTDNEAESFDVASILGKACVVSVTHREKEGKTYANITSVGKLMKGVDPKTIMADPKTPPIYYGPDNKSSYERLPEWLRKKIDSQILPKKDENEDQWADNQGNPTDDNTYITDDDIPF
jgi:hypothetical protein